MSSTVTWILLILSLPTASATARMRVWRALKALGCAALRDGAYLLPDKAPQRAALRKLADEAMREGGVAWVLELAAGAEDASFRSLFDRSEDYASFGKSLAQARAAVSRLPVQEIARLLRRLRKDYESIRAIDYFPNDASRLAEAAWTDFVNTAEQLISPGEPHPAEGAIARRDPDAYRGRTWATRRRLWVDRVASAWLIRRFIDPEATFLWLESPADCPRSALGFDFDGAAFTHVGERVTFEVLLASFGLERDPGLARMGGLVRALDTGNGSAPEASGFEAMLSGLRQQAEDDDRLLASAGIVLDALYRHFAGAAQQGA